MWVGRGDGGVPRGCRAQVATAQQASVVIGTASDLLRRKPVLLVCESIAVLGSLVALALLGGARENHRGGAPATNSGDTRGAEETRRRETRILGKLVLMNAFHGWGQFVVPFYAGAVFQGIYLMAYGRVLRPYEPPLAREDAR